ncbi:putative Ni/Fe-hydrogenase B-type cytochrome subunit [bacterium BMS3Abin04]|nr:putative Ni/Fe-hydrogenase B-type cytochrome subunit [bacterium BMS3Abin04]
MEDQKIKRVYVWEIPVRIYHWLNALVVVTLAVTGYLIGNPLAIQSSAEAYLGYWFGTVRFIHFVAAFIFFFNFLFRIYWGFAGNKYADWKNFIPYTKKYIRECYDVLKLDILHIKVKPFISVGHNALAGLTYFLTFLAFLFQSITGFGMYSAMSDSFFPKLFAWVVPFLGGDFAVRQWHHLMMWFFIIFAVVHVYIVFYHDYVERRGVLSSMAGGWKFIEKDKPT